MFVVNLFLFMNCLNMFSPWTQSALSLDKPCVPINECRQVKNLNENNYGTIILLNLVTCHTRNGIYVHCISQSEIQEFLNKANTLPDQYECGLEALETKIAQGDNATLDDFPWLALLKYRTKNNKESYGCHGNLINKRYLLTAAHCVDPQILARQPRKGNLYTAVLGEYDTENKTDCVLLDGGDEECTTAVEYEIESYKMHPDYKLNSTISVADIALVRLARDVEMNDYIRPICLPSVRFVILPNETFWIGGWGESEAFLFNRLKMKAKFQLKTNDKCVLDRNKFCTAAVDASPARTCAGDSGGPLMIRRQTKGDYRYYLVGVLSAGPMCSLYSKISIYTRITTYVRWIIETL